MDLDPRLQGSPMALLALPSKGTPNPQDPRPLHLLSWLFQCCDLQFPPCDHTEQLPFPRRTWTRTPRLWASGRRQARLGRYSHIRLHLNVTRSGTAVW